jgi:hypothetical protein
MGKGEMKLKDYFATGWGKNAVRYLKNGATIKVVIDTAPFSLSKRDGKIEVSQGAPKSHDVLFEISSSAIDYLCDAGTEDEAHERLALFAHHPTAERYSRMKIEVQPTERGRIDFFWMGYFFWARRMEFCW